MLTLIYLQGPYHTVFLGQNIELHLVLVTPRWTSMRLRVHPASGNTKPLFPRTSPRGRRWFRSAWRSWLICASSLAKHLDFTITTSSPLPPWRRYLVGSELLRLLAPWQQWTGLYCQPAFCFSLQKGSLLTLKSFYKSMVWPRTNWRSMEPKSFRCCRNTLSGNYLVSDSPWSLRHTSALGY